MPHRLLKTAMLLLSPHTRTSVASSTREELIATAASPARGGAATCKLKEGFGGFNQKTGPGLFDCDARHNFLFRGVIHRTPISNLEVD
jgi:hypothetical protein